MKKKILGFFVMAVCACVVASGCGKDENKEKKENNKAESLKVEDKKPDKEYEAIGNKTADSYEILITNSVGQDITGITAKSSDKQEWPDNMLASGKKFTKDETVKLYYTPEKEDTAVQEKTDKAVKPSYDVQLTFADGTICQLSSFAFEDMEEAAIKYEDKVAFLEYTSKETKEKVSTKEQELGLKAQKEQEEKARKEAEAQAAQAAQAAQDAQAVQEQVQPAEQYQPEYTEPDYSQSYEEPSYTEPEQPADQGTEGCLGGAEQSTEGCLQ